LAWLSPCPDAAECCSHHITLYVLIPRSPCFSSRRILTAVSAPSRRLLLKLTSHSGHLPHQPLLQILPASIQSGPSRPGRHKRNRQHSRPRPVGGPSRLLWHLHLTRRWRMAVQQQRNSAGRASQHRPRSTQLDLGREHVQGCCRLPVPIVSPHSYQQVSIRR
jgi:hypothetical protein